jgi:hypothetical protein
MHERVSNFLFNIGLGSCLCSCGFVLFVPVAVVVAVLVVLFVLIPFDIRAAVLKKQTLLKVSLVATSKSDSWDERSADFLANRFCG